MKKLKKYLKYYWLEEKYLFNEITKNFKKRGFLTPTEFFAIVIWKSPRAKTKIRKGIIKIMKKGGTIKRITSRVYGAKPQDKLKTLTEIPGIGIPMASAILTVCYPNDFTIVDYRSRASLNNFGTEINGDPTAKIYPYEAYFDYLEKCKMLAHKSKLTLRNFDRTLWAKDFYGGENGLHYLVRELK